MKIFLMVDDGGKITGWGNVRSNDTDIEYEISENDIFLRTPPFDYIFEDGKIIKSDFAHLERIKTAKKRELNRMCNKTILGRFTASVRGEEYQFSNDMEAQANFEKCARSFEKGFIEEIVWTAYDMEGNVTRIVVNQDEFDMIYYEHLNHINLNISKYRDFLQPLVEAAQTVEEVKNIVWGSELPSDTTPVQQEV